MGRRDKRRRRKKRRQESGIPPPPSWMDSKMEQTRTQALRPIYEEPQTKKKEDMPHEEEKTTPKKPWNFVQTGIEAGTAIAISTGVGFLFYSLGKKKALKMAEGSVLSRTSSVRMSRGRGADSEEEEPLTFEELIRRG